MKQELSQLSAHIEDRKTIFEYGSLLVNLNEVRSDLRWLGMLRMCLVGIRIWIGIHLDIR